MVGIKIYEMFAGVGGFRVGFERVDEGLFNTVLANQWEPGKKNQFAYDCYNKNYPNSINLNEDVSTIPDEYYQGLGVDMVVGGHPCQSFSVASTSKDSKGLESDKGELFWEVARALEQTQATFFLIENVDRMLKSPTKQRGRDFLIMLQEYTRLGYTVEWRVINASEYGMTQKRRRVFLFGYLGNSPYGQHMAHYSMEDVLREEGVYAKTFPHTLTPTQVSGDLGDSGLQHVFHTSGIARGSSYLTNKSVPVTEDFIPLGDLLESHVGEEYYLTPEKEARFGYLRGAKKFDRVSSGGHSYTYSEGSMSPYDGLDKPSRTILTSEGNVSRSTHIIKDPETGRLRYLTPLECERAMMFPDNWTSGITKRQRYFVMGNAIVTGVVSRFAEGFKAHVSEFLT